MFFEVFIGFLFVWLMRKWNKGEEIQLMEPTLRKGECVLEVSNN